MYVNGQTLPAAQLNGNFNTIVTDYNGNITNANISGTANIAVTKLNLGTIVPALGLNSAGSVTWASGITGDANPRIALYTDGFLKFGAGGGSAVDIMLKRLSATQLGVRNAADSADENIRVAALELKNTNIMTLTPAALGADRAITVKDPGAAANLVFSTGTLNSNGVIYTDGTNFLSTATGGSGTKVLTSVGGAAPSFTSPSYGFGGDGSDGAVAGSGTDAAFKQYNATTYSVANAVTHTVKSGTIINCTSTATIGGGASGGVTVSQQMSGGAGAANTGIPAAQGGAGPAPGAPQSSGQSYGGGGGGCGGAGGYAGVPNAVTGGNSPGGAAIYSAGGFGLVGSGGAGGAAQTGVGAGGAGGAGGGRLVIAAVGAISVASGATVSAVGTNGSAGVAGTAGGGGGGSGGVVILASQTSTAITGTVTVIGGNGGASAGTGGGGGGGGGGVIVQWSPSNAAAGSRTVSGGSAGTTTGSGSAAQAGTSGVSVQITGTPNIPLLGWIEKNPAKLALISPNTNNREVAALAAGNDLALYWQYRTGSLSEQCEAIGDGLDLIPAA